MFSADASPETCVWGKHERIVLGICALGREVRLSKGGSNTVSYRELYQRN